jgi:hypothetical protein
MSNNIPATEWRRRIEAWKRSGQTAGEYGARHGINPRQLYWWSWWLRKNGAPEVGDAERAGQQPVRLLPVRVVATAMSPVVAAPSSPRCAEVALVGNRVLRIAADVDPDWAARLVVRVAQELETC